MNITLNLTPELRLEQALKNAGIANPASVTKLTVNGTLTEDDCKFIRFHMGETLQKLDMRNALVENRKFSIIAFTLCSGLVHVRIPNSVIEFNGERLGECFEYCSGLTSINAHHDHPVYASENGVLLSKDKTELIFCPEGRMGVYKIPASVTKIVYGAFHNCTKLKSVTIPDSVTEIENYAFYNCINMDSVFIPVSVYKIGKPMFDEWQVTVHPDNPVYKSEGGKLKCKETKSITVNLTPETGLEQSLKNAEIDNPASVTKLTVTGMITEDDCLFICAKMRITLRELNMSGAWFEENTIPDYAFYNCIGLTSVIIPEMTYGIGYYAFSDCISLVSVNIPDLMTRFALDCFFGCTRLKSMTIPAWITETIGENAFRTLLFNSSEFKNEYIMGVFDLSDPTNCFARSLQATE